jgi:excisionase family DNA binding protein
MSAIHDGQIVERVRGGSPASGRVWLNVGEAAEYAGISRDTIYTACERDELRHVRVGGRRAIRMKAEWIDAWLERYARGDSPPSWIQYRRQCAVNDAPRCLAV